jgi:zinc and cadmium transporter
MSMRLILLLALCGVVGIHSGAGLRAQDARERVGPPPSLEDVLLLSSAVPETGPKFPVLIGYCVLIVLASLCGGYLPSLIRLDHNRMQTMISFVGGLMLGIGVFHMLPHALHETGDIDFVAAWMMIGLLVMFFLLRTFHFHQHDLVVEDDVVQPAQLASEEAAVPQDEPSAHGDHHHHHPAHACDHSHNHAHAHHLSWVGIAVGLSLHTLIDGLALGAAIEADSRHEVALSLFGFGIFLAILLHKPLDAMSITSLMSAGGWSKSARNLVNLGFSLMCPLGAVAFMLGVNQLDENQHYVVGGALAASGGVFICIALSDLLPEMEFHSHNRLRLSTSLVLGVLLAWAIGFLEPEHAHHSPASSPATHSHTHEHGHYH